MNGAVNAAEGKMKKVTKREQELTDAIRRAQCMLSAVTACLTPQQVAVVHSTMNDLQRVLEG